MHNLRQRSSNDRPRTGAIPTNGTIDIREMMKRQINDQIDYTDVQPRTRGETHSTHGPARPHEEGFAEVGLYFDTSARTVIDDDPAGIIQWSIPDQNNLLDVENCVVLSVDEFLFPKIWAPAKLDFFYYKRAYMELTIVPSQRKTRAPKTNYTIEFRVEDADADRVKFIPAKKEFYFTDPITTMSLFRVAFYVPPMSATPAPFWLIPIPKDFVKIQMATLPLGNGYNPVRFTILNGQTCSALFYTAIGPASAVIFVTGFSSGIPAIDAQVNDPTGIIVTNILDDFTFEVAGIDTTFVFGTFLTAIMFIPRNRIGIPTRFTSVTARRTNNVTVSHD